MIQNIYDVVRHCCNDVAVIYCDNIKIQKLTYQDVKEMSNIFFDNLKYLSRDSICLGLLMHHNIFIPSLIFSLQRLNYSFCFLDVNQINASELINKIGVKYIILYNVKCYIPNSKFLFSIVIDLNNVYDVYVCSNDARIYENINYIVQTSGTTNVQKIVRVEHACIRSNIICLRNKLQITNKDIIYFGTPLTFDPSIVELYLALTTGAKLVIVSEAIKQNSVLLYKTLFQNKKVNITVLQMCPSTILQWSICDIENILRNSNVRILLLGGERFPAILQTLERSKNLKMYNIYGITELSCWAFLGEVEEDEISLGDVLDDTIFEIKDANDENITEGEGELAIGSYHRICYIDDEQPNTIVKPLMRKTGDRVILKENKMIYKGRCNDEIKRFGHRVNLAYIENAIHLSTGLKCICVWLEIKRKLVLYVVIDEVDKVVALKIKDKLRIKILHILPKECMPDYIELLRSVPLTKNGKADRAMLSSKADILLQETTIMNKCLVVLFKSLWSKYFGNLGSEVTNKTFYELGATSIMRIQISEEFKQMYDGLLPPFILEYIFTNTYDDVCTFLQGIQINENKRKLDGIDNNIRKKKVNDQLHIEWAYDLHACVDSIPVILRRNRFVVVGSFSNILAVLNLNTGEEITKVVLPNAIESSCLVSNCENYIYIGCYDHNMYCIEVSTGKIVWLYTTGDRIKNKPVFICADTIIFGSYDKSVHCINSKDGTKVWKQYIGAAITSDALLVGDNIIVATIKGCCLCLNRYGNIIWEINLGCPLFGSPTELSNGFVIPDVLGTIHCINFSGQKLWEIKVQENIYSSILSFGNYLIFGTHHSNIYCFEYSVNNLKPVLKHKISIDSATSSTPTTIMKDNKPYIVAACISGYIYLINTDDFSITSRLKINGDVFSSPVVIENNILIGCRDNHLICIKVR